MQRYTPWDKKTQKNKIGQLRLLLIPFNFFKPLNFVLLSSLYQLDKSLIPEIGHYPYCLALNNYKSFQAERDELKSSCNI